MEIHSLEEEVLELFHRGVHLLHRSGPHWRRHGKRTPMPPAQGRLLRLLAASGPLTQRRLGEMLDIRSASLSELLGKLERPGWIRRRPNENDKRTIDIDLTEEGEKMLGNIGNERAEMAEEIFGALKEEELQQLHSLLGKLIDDWETRFENESGRPRFGRRHDGESRPEGDGGGWLRRMRGHFHHHHHHHHGPHDHHDHDGFLEPHGHQTGHEAAGDPCDRRSRCRRHEDFRGHHDDFDREASDQADRPRRSSGHSGPHDGEAD